MSYNGWTNYETWAVKLWIDNDQGSQEYWLEAARELVSDYDEDWNPDRDEYLGNVRTQLADRLKDEHEEAAQEIINPHGSGDSIGVFGDLLGAALGSVDWREIAESIMGDAIEIHDQEAAQEA